MSGDLLTDEQLAEIQSRADGGTRSYEDVAVALNDRWRLLDHITAINRRISALNSRNALPCPKCGHQRVPE